MSPNGEDQASSTTFTVEEFSRFLHDIFGEDEFEMTMEWTGNLEGPGTMDLIIAVPDVSLEVSD